MTDERVFRKIGPGLWMNVFDISKSDTVSRQIVVQPKNKNKNKRKTDIYRLTLPQFDISICAKIKKYAHCFSRGLLGGMEAPNPGIELPAVINHLTAINR